jgi:hypothetical protein
MPPELKSVPTALNLIEEPYRILLYGDFGRRKTTLAGTFPNALIIDTNGGLVSIALQGRHPVSWTPDGHEDLEALYFWIKEQVEAGGDEIETIVIDTVDNLALQLMGEITEDAVFEKQRAGKKVSLRMRFVPEQGDYFANQQQMFRFLTALRRLGKHIVLVSSVRTKSGRTAPNVSDGLERVLCDFVSVVGELVILDEVDDEDKAEYPELYDECGLMFTAESNTRATKSRYRSIKPFVVDPTFDKLDAAIRAEIEEAQQRPGAGRK